MCLSVAVFEVRQIYPNEIMISSTEKELRLEWWRDREITEWTREKEYLLIAGSQQIVYITTIEMSIWTIWTEKII